MGKKGFMLIEILLAIVILSTSITLIIQAMAGSFRISVVAEQYLEAAIALDNQMAITIGGLSLKEADKKYKIDEVVEPLDKTKEETKNFLNINKVEISTLWFSGRKKNKLFLESYMFDFDGEVYAKQKE